MTGNSDGRDKGRTQGRIIEAAEAEFDKPSNSKREEGRTVCRHGSGAWCRGVVSARLPTVVTILRSIWGSAMLPFF